MSSSVNVADLVRADFYNPSVADYLAGLPESIKPRGRLYDFKDSQGPDVNALQSDAQLVFAHNLLPLRMFEMFSVWLDADFNFLGSLDGRLDDFFKVRGYNVEDKRILTENEGIPMSVITTYSAEENMARKLVSFRSYRGDMLIGCPAQGLNTSTSVYVGGLILNHGQTVLKPKEQD